MAETYSPSTFGWLAFTACFFGWAAFELIVNLRWWSAGSTNRDRLSRYLIIGGVLLAMSLAIISTRFHRFDIIGARASVFYFGLGTMVAGLVFRWAAIRQLGRFFIPEVAIQPGQRVIDRGLYHYLRHPSYTGTFITVTGYGLALTNWLSLAAMLAVCLPVYLLGVTQLRVDKLAEPDRHESLLER